MAKSSIFISSFPMDLSAVPLGLMVAFIKNPTQDSFDPALRLPNPPVLQSSTITSNHISKILKASNGTGLELTLAAFASVFFKGETKDVRQLEAKKGNQYLLQNVDDWFERVCKDNLAQTWLERAAMRGRKAYLITGLQTLTDTDIKHNASWTLGTGGGVQAPLLSATGIPLPTPLRPCS